MKRNALTFLLLGFGMLVLAACSGGGGGPVLPERTELDAEGDGTAAFTGTLAIGETHYFEIAPGSVTGDLVVVELNEDLRLEQTTVTGATVAAASTGPEHFQRGTISATSGAAELEPNAIGVTPDACEGSCIVLRNSNEEWYFQVSGAVIPTTYSVFVYGDDYADTEEPTNNTPAGAAAYVGSVIGGAIETVGDIDWWAVAVLDLEGEEVEFLANGDLGLALYRVRGDATTGPYVSGETLNVQTGDMLRVESASGRAARGTNSLYYLSPVPDPTAAR